MTFWKGPGGVLPTVLDRRRSLRTGPEWMPIAFDSGMYVSRNLTGVKAIGWMDNCRAANDMR